ncbi:protein YLS3-like isoform X3 [Papaver somniferum]|uniref:protein YLS3-like isoform X3 n=1 Tax=Papaver somniferum TaxID=3469 RepID=UPI000E6FC4F2|nr:protein YLS3-like isoform X3 [Papaver somniferum]
MAALLRIMEMVLLVVLVTAFKTHVTAQSSTNVITGMAPTLTYITENSSTPSPSCCSQLTSVVQTQLECLCSILNTGAGATLGLAISRTLALALPSACNVQTPSIDRCNAGHSCS